MIRVGNALVQFDERKIIFKSATFSLEPKTAKLLNLLICHQGLVVSRQQILDAIYPAQYISDNAINRLVADLRKIFKADPESLQYIETIPKKGYKLVVAAVTEVNHQIPATNDQAKDTEVSHDEFNGAVTSDQWGADAKLKWFFVATVLVLMGLSFALFNSRTFVDVSQCESLEPFFISGTNSRDYNVCSYVDSDNKQLFFLQNRIDSPDGFVTLMQLARSPVYRGKTITISAAVKTEYVDDGAIGFFLRGQKEYKGSTNAFINSEMVNQLIVTNKDWHNIALTLTIPQESEYIAYGVYLRNNANVWVKDFKIDSSHES